MDSSGKESACQKDVSRTSTPFTFTIICHLGKTHSHRSRGDTTWEAQKARRRLTVRRATYTILTNLRLRHATLVLPSIDHTPQPCP